MHHSPLWDANRFSARQEIPCTIWNFKVHCWIHNSCPYFEPDQSSPCPQHTSWKTILILSPHLRLGFPDDIFPSGFPTKNLYELLLFLIIRATFPAHLVPLELFTQIMFDEESSSSQNAWNAITSVKENTNIRKTCKSLEEYSCTYQTQNTYT